MADIFDKYPLAEKAAEENAMNIEGVFFFLGGEAACLEAPKRIAEIVDQTVEDADVMKEAMIIGIYFSMNADMMEEGVPDNFEDEYTPEARMIVDEMFILANLPGAVISNNILKTQAVFAVASLEAVREMLIEVNAHRADNGVGAETQKQLSAEMIEGMKEQIAEDEKRLLPGLADAPKLKDLYLKTKNEVFALIEKPAAGSKAAPKPEDPKI